MSWKADVFQDIIVPSDFVRIKTFSSGRAMEFTNLSRLKRFFYGQTLTHNNLSVKYALFTDKLGLGDCLHNLFSSAVAYQ